MKVTFYEDGTQAGYIVVPQEIVKRLATRYEDYIAGQDIDTSGTKWVEITEDITIDGINIEFTCEIQFDCVCRTERSRGDHETPSNFRAWLELSDVGILFDEGMAYFPNDKECECVISDASDLERMISREITVVDYDYWG